MLIKTGFWNIRILDMIRYTIRHLYQTRSSARNYRKQYGEKNRKLTEVRNLCQCKTRIPLCQLFLSVQFLRLIKNYTSLFNFSIILRSSSLENPPKLISARSGMESVMARVISSEMASEAASEADSSPPFMAER